MECYSLKLRIANQRCTAAWFVVYSSFFNNLSLFTYSAFELPFLCDLLGYAFSNATSISLDDSLTHLSCIGLRYKDLASAGTCTSKDNTDSSFITIGLPLGEKLVLSSSFIEWFRGFTDAEGSFIIAKGKGNVFSFNFVIGLHLDDKDTLEFISNTLGFGKIIVNSKEARFTVNTQRDVAVIIEIFSKYCLNTTKHLNFLAFERAYNTYMENNNPEARKKSKIVIDKIISEMNSKRTDFYLSPTHYNITTNWLLGFVEGDGWFSYNIDARSFTFGIIQKGNQDLFEAIVSFLHNLASLELGSEAGNQNSVANVYPKDTGAFFMVIKRKIIIEKVIIPLFDSVTWHSKKYLDYCDWKSILNLRNMGLHYLPEGKALIERITQQMNNYRLSSSLQPKIDRPLLEIEINRLLNGPSNYEIREGKTFIKSLDRYLKHEEINKAISVQLVDGVTDNIISTFNSYNDCAKFLGTSRSSVSNRAVKNNKFKHEGRLVYLQKIFVSLE